MEVEGNTPIDPSSQASLMKLKAATLEQRYIQLLEQRIAALEALVAPAPSNNLKEVEKPNGVKDGLTISKVNNDDLQTEAGAESKTATAQNGSHAQTQEAKASLETNGTANESTESKFEEGTTASTSGEEPEGRVKNVVTKWSDEKRRFEDVESKRILKDESKPGRVLSTFRRVMDIDNDKKLDREEIDIDSLELKRLYMSCTRHIQPLSNSDNEPLKLSSPFVDLIWSWDRFTTACEPQDNDSEGLRAARDDLKALMGYVKSSALESYFRVRDSNFANNKITYEWLWTIFRPGAKVYARSFMNEMQMFEVDSCDYPDEAESKTQGKACSVFCSAFDWDGVNFTRYSYEFEIKKKELEKEKDVSTLPCYPVEYYRDQDGNRDDSALRKKLIERGAKFCAICTADVGDYQWRYKGPVITDQPAGMNTTGSSGGNDDATSSFGGSSSDPGNVSNSKTVEVDCRVIVDNWTFLRSDRNRLSYDMPPLGDMTGFPASESDCQCQSCKASPTRKWQGKKFKDADEQGEEFAKDDERLLLCPPKVLGYILARVRQAWAQFRIDALRPINSERDKESRKYFYTKLKLDEEKKTLLMAFMQHHESSRQRRSGKDSSKSSDPIEGKGQGLAILLHGAPGVGKTLTAETVALTTSKPLLIVSVAEIGMDAKQAEGKLVAIFNDAARWGAVLLIDEADVFLEERKDVADPNRNALVSVMLRCLEYYQGIIILTTNRINALDVAVQSRIHLAIQYKDLSQDQRIAIYEDLLKEIPDKNISNRKVITQKLARICKPNIQVNGRQIRNIVMAAQALAQHEGEEKLTFEHIETVHEATKEFNDSLKDMTTFKRMRNEVNMTPG